jgi:hypothetical protein
MLHPYPGLKPWAGDLTPLRGERKRCAPKERRTYVLPVNLVKMSEVGGGRIHEIIANVALNSFNSALGVFQD